MSLRRKSVPLQAPLPELGQPRLTSCLLPSPAPSQAPPSAASGPPGASSGDGLINQANALAWMTFELNIRSIGLQANQLEKDIKALVICTERDKEFRAENEKRLREVWREVVVVQEHLATVRSCQSSLEADMGRLGLEFAAMRRLLEHEVTELKRGFEHSTAQLAMLSSEEPQSQDSAKSSQTVRVEAPPARRDVPPKRPAVKPLLTRRAHQIIAKRIKEAISSTRRWNSDHKTTTLKDPEFVANYLKQQSKRDQAMAVFIQKSIHRRIRGRIPRSRSRPESLEEFCQNVKWSDVTEAIEDVLVKSEEKAIEALH
ncbi:hypothetical protein B0I35DRAFT_473339 [Stachybotrys elegans]|uniref:Uncharacterized protein n=1 Tax=Stachybotrys elegans TaxID=80388 RepID=A0A8K0T1T2_9HYPO|nr:hypothetical protein B0I35DRAFT_473339 [Stachybotrys elegans]